MDEESGSLDKNFIFGAIVQSAYLRERSPFESTL